MSRTRIPRQSRPDAVQLSNFKWTLLDSVDIDFIRQYGLLDSAGYASFVVDHKKYLVHREIMARIIGRTLDDDERVDHVNGNTLDNRRANLRLASQMQNAWNSRMKSTNKSGYKGVFRNRNGVWVASIKHNYKGFYIGFFFDKTEAAWMYDQYALALFGDFAKTNFEYLEM